MGEGEPQEYKPSYIWRKSAEGEGGEEIEIDKNGSFIEGLKNFLRDKLGLSEGQVTPYVENESDNSTFQLNCDCSKEDIANLIRTYFWAADFEVAQFENPRDEGMMLARKEGLILSIVVTVLTRTGRAMISVREMGGPRRYYPKLIPEDESDEGAKADVETDVDEGTVEEQSE